MSDIQSTPATAAPLLEVVKTADFDATVPEFVPFVKQTKETVESVPKLPRLIECLPSGGLLESQSNEGIDLTATYEDILTTPTPTSVSSFSQLVSAARAAQEPHSADVSMLSMTDDDSDISLADVSLVDEPELEPTTPVLPLSNSELDDLEVSPTGGVGGGVRCGIPKPVEPAPVEPAANRFLEGLVLQKGNHEPRQKYRRE
jgi:hypothetical protein